MRKNDQMPLEEGSIIFFCFTSVLDRMIMERKSTKDVAFSQELADQLDANDSGFYFVVGFNYDYCVAPVKMIQKLNIPSGPQTEEITACMNHFIDAIT